MIKEEIVSVVRNLTPKEDKTKRFHERFLEAIIENVLREMYTDLYKINPLLLNLYTKSYGESTAITIAQDPTTNIYYSTLPAKIINLPSKQSGVRSIYPVVHTGNVFNPMSADEADRLFNTDVAVVSSKIGYRTRQDTRVDYWNMNDTVLVAGVRMDLLIPFSVYSDSDVVMIPELGEKEGGDFITRVMTALQIVPLADLQDDNAPKEEAQKNR